MEIIFTLSRQLASQYLLELSNQSLSAFCKSSKKCQALCTRDNHYLWKQKLVRDFPDFDLKDEQNAKDLYVMLYDQAGKIFINNVNCNSNGWVQIITFSYKWCLMLDVYGYLSRLDLSKKIALNSNDNFRGLIPVQKIGNGIKRLFTNDCECLGLSFDDKIYLLTLDYEKEIVESVQLDLNITGNIKNISFFNHRYTGFNLMISVLTSDGKLFFNDNVYTNVKDYFESRGTRIILFNNGHMEYYNSEIKQCEENVVSIMGFHNEYIHDILFIKTNGDLYLLIQNMSKTLIAQNVKHAGFNLDKQYYINYNNVLFIGNQEVGFKEIDTNVKDVVCYEKICYIKTNKYSKN